MFTLFTASFLAVLKIVLVCAAGTWLAWRGIMTAEFRSSLSRVILLLMLPCLLVSKLSVNVNLANLMRWGILPALALVFIVTGMLLGKLLVWACRPPEELRRVLTAATAFGNSGYVPYPLVMALAASAPLFANDPGAADRGIAYISVYLVCMSPCLWGIGFPYLAHKPLGHLKREQLLSPPVISVITAIVLGMTPPLRRLLIEADAPLRIIMDTAELIGMGAIPCALLILGANLATSGSREAQVPPRLILAVAVSRLVILPLVGCGLVMSLLKLGVIPRDPMCALVLMIQASVPPATNLIVMCQVHNRGEAAMSRILVWCYIACIPTLTVFVAIFLWLVSNI